MKSTQPFDYTQPTRDSLTGIFVEVSDEPLEATHSVKPEPGSSSTPPSATLFGLTQTADDSAAAGSSAG
jgi:hypothetical protein